MHFLSSTFPKGDALRDRGRHGAGKLRFVIEQRIIPSGYRSLNSRLQISEPTQLADDLVTDLLEDLGNVHLVAVALGAAYTLSGRIADAVPLFIQEMEQTTATARVDLQALCNLSPGEAQMLAGRPEEAQSLAVRALTLARAHREHGNEAYALHLLGGIAARRDAPTGEHAAVHYQHALILAKELGIRPLQVHCHRGLGTWSLHSSQRQEAHTTLTTAITLYRAMGMTFWLPQAKVALAQVDVTWGVLRLDPHS